MSLSRADVEKVALLGRLRLTPDELDKLTDQLGAIVGYIDLLAELNTDDVEPMAHAVELTNVFRADEERPACRAKQRWQMPRTRMASAILFRRCSEIDRRCR